MGFLSIFTLNCIVSFSSIWNLASSFFKLSHTFIETTNPIRTCQSDFNDNQSSQELQKLVVKIKYTLFDIFILKGTVEQQQQKQIKTKLRTRENLE